MKTGKVVSILTAGILLVALLAGCGGGATTPTPTTSSASPTPSPTPSATEMQVAAVLYGVANEGTWEPAAYNAILDAQKKLNFKLNLSENTSTQDAEKIIRDWASRGVTAIWAHSSIYNEALIKVAGQFPNVYFIAEGGYAEDSPADPKPEAGPEKFPANVVMLGDTPGEGNFLAGYVAALASIKGAVGVLQPFESTGLNYYTNTFVQGAKLAKPDIKVQVVMVGDYVAPAETRTAIQSLAQQGFDMIFTQMDDNSSILECKAQGILCIPMYMDKHDLDPETVLTSVVFNWFVPLYDALAAVKDNTFATYRETNFFRPLSVKDNGLYLGQWGTKATDEIKNAAEDVKAKIISGEIKVLADYEKKTY
jgi:basic membrane protein A